MSDPSPERKENTLVATLQNRIKILEGDIKVLRWQCQDVEGWVSSDNVSICQKCGIELKFKSIEGDPMCPPSHMDLDPSKRL